MAGWRSGASGGGADRLHVRLRRGKIRAVGRLEGEIAVPAARWGEVARAIAAAVADASAGRTLGEVAVVEGEPPILASFRARRDVVANRVLAALTAGAGHRRPTLWLALNDGVFLGSAVDPERPFELAAESLAAIVRGGLVAHALTADAAPRAGGVALRFDIFAPPSSLRALLRTARRHLGTVRGWNTAR